NAEKGQVPDLPADAHRQRAGEERPADVEPAAGTTAAVGLELHLLVAALDLADDAAIEEVLSVERGRSLAAEAARAGIAAQNVVGGLEIDAEGGERMKEMMHGVAGAGADLVVRVV